MARTTPLGMEINYREFVLGFGQIPIKLGDGIQVYNGHDSCRELSRLPWNNRLSCRRGNT
ncbi:hypothetical protein B0H10DRAFT_2019313 [Mycena sp. CBHHK59/15]|nr:hypothetical protein B0H10DRAFT_2019313 [Mycena sp. CBHHK59/15]